MSLHWLVASFALVSSQPLRLCWWLNRFHRLMLHKRCLEWVMTHLSSGTWQNIYFGPLVSWHERYLPGCKFCCSNQTVYNFHCCTSAHWRSSYWSLIMSAKRFISAGVLCGFQLASSFMMLLMYSALLFLPPICCVEAFPS